MNLHATLCSVGRGICRVLFNYRIFDYHFYNHRYSIMGKNLPQELHCHLLVGVM